MEPNNNTTSPNMGGMSGKKSSKWIWIAAVLIIVIGLIIVFSSKKPLSETVPPTGDTTSQPTPELGVNEEAPTSPAASLSYVAALKKYGANRLQVNASCSIPSPYVNLTFKAGTSIMLDNRSNESHTLLVNGTNYALGPYGFRIVTLNTVKKFFVDCDKQQNVATITIQK